MKGKFPEMDILIFGSYDVKFVKKVYATSEYERDYLLCVAARKLKKGKNREKYEVSAEIRDNLANLLKRSGIKGIISKCEEAGSFCFIYAKNTLCERLGEHLRGNARLEEALKCSRDSFK